VNDAVVVVGDGDDHAGIVAGEREGGRESEREGVRA